MSQSLTNKTFPYTIAYVCNQLGVEESRIHGLCQRFGIHPHHDESTGTLFFSLQDVETLKKVVEAETKGEAISTQIATAKTTAPAFTAKSHYASPAVRSEGSRLSRADLSVIVESVSNAKEGILKDLSQLLDDKLSGLDDVVVELIRSKSEIDSLQNDIEKLEADKARLETELSKFKPVAFGFWRKEG